MPLICMKCGNPPVSAMNCSKCNQPMGVCAICGNKWECWCEIRHVRLKVWSYTINIFLLQHFYLNLFCLVTLLHEPRPKLYQMMNPLIQFIQFHGEFEIFFIQLYYRLVVTGYRRGPFITNLKLDLSGWQTLGVWTRICEMALSILDTASYV